MNSLLIASVDIKTDEHGRFCLNDLHRASGGHPSSRPGEFIRNQQTQTMITHLERDSGSTVIDSRGGRAGGTYVCKELVYAYATWISPQFHIEVIRAYDRMRQAQLDSNAVQTNGRTYLPDFTDPIQAARAWADEAEKARTAGEQIARLANLALAQERVINVARPAMEFAHAVTNSKDTLSISEFAKLMGTGQQRMFELLRSQGVLGIKGVNHNIPYQKYIDEGYFRVNQTTHEDPLGNVHLNNQPRITTRGQMYLQQRFFPQMDAIMGPHQQAPTLAAAFLHNAREPLTQHATAISNMSMSDLRLTQAPRFPGVPADKNPTAGQVIDQLRGLLNAPASRLSEDSPHLFLPARANSPTAHATAPTAPAHCDQQYSHSVSDYEFNDRRSMSRPRG